MKNGRIKPLVAGLLIYLLIGLIYGWSIFCGAFGSGVWLEQDPNLGGYLPYP